MKPLITGAEGQLGRALVLQYPNAIAVTRAELDIANIGQVMGFDASDISCIINAAAYTDVDKAETTTGAETAQRVNSIGPANLALLAEKFDVPLVHYSSDYVFDGTKNCAYTEEDGVNPMSVYGQSKLAGDVAALTYHKAYVIRTSWVIGDGPNFVRVMLKLGSKGVSPSVVCDQIGRPTFASNLAQATNDILRLRIPFGLYNYTSSGDKVSWAGLSRKVFELAGYRQKVADTSTALYLEDKPGSAPRPLNSLLDLSKIETAGIITTDWRELLETYVMGEIS